MDTLLASGSARSCGLHKVPAAGTATTEVRAPGIVILVLQIIQSTGIAGISWVASRAELKLCLKTPAMKHVKLVVAHGRFLFNEAKQVADVSNPCCNDLPLDDVRDLCEISQRNLRIGPAMHLYTDEGNLSRSIIQYGHHGNHNAFHGSQAADHECPRGVIPKHARVVMQLIREPWNETCPFYRGRTDEKLFVLPLQASG